MEICMGKLFCNVVLCFFRVVCRFSAKTISTLLILSKVERNSLLASTRPTKKCSKWKQLGSFSARDFGPGIYYKGLQKT